jgi:hypothetical protein
VTRPFETSSWRLRGGCECWLTPLHSDRQQLRFGDSAAALEAAVEACVLGVREEVALASWTSVQKDLVSSVLRHLGLSFRRTVHADILTLLCQNVNYFDNMTIKSLDQGLGTGKHRREPLAIVFLCQGLLEMARDHDLGINVVRVVQYCLRRRLAEHGFGAYVDAAIAKRLS